MKPSWLASAAALLSAIALVLWLASDRPRSAAATLTVPVLTEVRPETPRSAAMVQLESPVPTPARRQAVARLQVPVLHGAESGAISGVVENLRGAPIAGAACELLPDSAPVGLAALVHRKRKPRAVHASVHTDALGAFRIEAPPGFWTLRVAAEGRSSWEEGAVRSGEFRRVRLGPRRELLVRVLDERGAAIPDAVVSLLRGEYYDPRGATRVRSTDGGGVARFDNVPSGTWFAHLRHMDYVGAAERVPRASALLTEFEVVLERGVRIEGRVTLVGGHVPPQPARIQFDTYDDFLTSHEVLSGPDGSYQSRIALPEGDSLEVAALVPGYAEVREQVELPSPSSSSPVRVDFVLKSLERRAVGRVAGPDGAPLEGIPVYVKPITSLPDETVLHVPSLSEQAEGASLDPGAHDPVESKLARFRPACLTDATGRFEVTGLHAQRAYKLLLVSEQHSNAVLWCEEGEPGGITDFGTVRLAAGGRVWGDVRRPDGNPIEGALVYIVSLTRQELAPGSEIHTRRPSSQVGLLDAVTNADGAFAIEPLPEAQFMLMCLGTLFGPYSVTEGERLGPLVLVTEDAHRRSTARTVPVTIEVLTDQGQPLESAFVTLRPTGSTTDGDGFPVLNDITYALTDGAGRLQRNVVLGSYRVVVLDMTGQHAREEIELLIDPREAEVYRLITLRAAAFPAQELSGLVLDATGSPLAGMQVTLIPATGEIACNCMKLGAETDAAGSFSFGPLLPGNHRLIVTDPAQVRPTAHHYPARPGDPITVTMD